MSGATFATATYWWEVPYGTVLRRIDDGETVMVIAKGNSPDLITASLVLPPEGYGAWTVMPGDVLGPFPFLVGAWEIVR